MMYEPLNDTVIILNYVLTERIAQDQKWGVQNHSPADWITILVEEVGEASKEALEFKFGPSPAESLKRYKTELIQVAAVAVAMVECLDRNSGEKL